MSYIYERELHVYTLSAGTLLQGKLQLVSRHLYAEREVYHSRFWESVQAGSQIDLMVCVPDGRAIRADMYCIPDDGHVYRIVQAQQGWDDLSLPMTTLSLRRMEAAYDIARS
nr:MAG TPA_asm: hypothetical protein [Caudoviricetes sp.]